MNQKDCDGKVEGIVEGIMYWATDNVYGDCDECEHYHCWDERHPYGDGTATERLCECRVPEDRQCPVVEQVAAALYQRVNGVTKTEASK